MCPRLDAHSTSTNHIEALQRTIHTHQTQGHFFVIATASIPVTTVKPPGTRIRPTPAQIISQTHLKLEPDHYPQIPRHAGSKTPLTIIRLAQADEATTDLPLRTAPADRNSGAHGAPATAAALGRPRRAPSPQDPQPNRRAAGPVLCVGAGADALHRAGRGDQVQPGPRLWLGRRARRHDAGVVDGLHLDPRRRLVDGCRDSCPHRPLQARARLRPLPARHPLGCCDAILGAAAAPHGVVVFDGAGERRVGRHGDVGVSVSPTATIIFWRRRGGVYSGREWRTGWR